MRICYIDDVERDREKYRARLEGVGLHVDALPPPQDLNIDTVRQGKPDLFLIDYLLYRKEVNRPTVDYSGTILSAKIREAFPGHPIVLLTRKNLLVQAYKQGGEFEKGLDEILYKDAIEEDPEATARGLKNLADGFKLIRAKRNRTFAALVDLLEAKGEEVDLLRRAGPPPHGESKPSPHVWSVPDAAKWIRNVVLHYPGILYDKLYAATALGISLDSFRSPRVKRLFKDAAYGGVFRPTEGRWWRGRLFSTAQRFIAAANLSGPTNLSFADAYRKRFRARLKPAKCVYSDEVPADCVCYILGEPVKRQYSFPYHPDDRPPAMDEARVSFTAVLEGNRAIKEFFDSETLKLVEKLRSEQER